MITPRLEITEIQQQKQQESRLRSRHILWTPWKKRTVAGKNVHELCNSTPYLIHSKRRKKATQKKPKKLRRVEFSVLRSYDTSRWTWNRRCVKWKIKAPLQYEPTRLKEKLWKKVENLIWLTWVALFSHFSVVTRKKERKKKSQLYTVTQIMWFQLNSPTELLLEVLCCCVYVVLELGYLHPAPVALLRIAFSLYCCQRRSAHRGTVKKKKESDFMRMPCVHSEYHSRATYTRTSGRRTVV